MSDHTPHITLEDQRVLMEAIASGDHKAFGSLLRIYGDTIFSQAMAYVKNHELAEELTQDIFVKVWNNRTKLGQVESLENWLFIVARNLVFDSFKKKLSVPLVPTIPEDFTYEDNTPDLQTEARASYQLLLKGIGQLPEKRQRVFRMSRLEGMTHKEIAQTLGIHEITVAQYIVKSLSFLKEYLQKNGTDAIVILIILRGWQ